MPRFAFAACRAWILDLIPCAVVAPRMTTWYISVPPTLRFVVDGNLCGHVGSTSPKGRTRFHVRQLTTVPWTTAVISQSFSDVFCNRLFALLLEPPVCLLQRRREERLMSFGQ